MKRKLITLLSILTATLAAQAQFVLQPMTSFGPHGDGTLRTNDYSFITINGTGNAPHNRGLAYNPVSGHVLVVDKDPLTPSIHILDATTGVDLGQLDLSSLAAGGNVNFPINMIGVADDGAIYVCNLSSSQFPPEFRLYRWNDEASAQSLVFPPIGTGTIGDPSNGNTNSYNKRWGDTIAVRGTGTNTQVLVSSRGTLAAILSPTDNTMASFASTPLDCPVAIGGMGFGLAFGPGNTFYGTAGGTTGGPLYYLGFDPSTGIATNINTFRNTEFSGSVTPITVSTPSNWLAGISVVSGADAVQLYDRSVNPPLLLSRLSFVTTESSSSIGALAFANDRLYALDAENGIMAMTVVPGTANMPPLISVQPAGKAITVSSNFVFSVGADGSLPLSYQWYFNTNTPIVGGTNSTLAITNAQQANAGHYNVIVSNSYGSVTSSYPNLIVTAALLNTRLVYEPFNYAAGTAISNNPPWTASTSGTGLIEADSLTNAALQQPLGNKFTWSTTSLSARYPIGVTNSSGEFYYSFLYRVDTLGTSASLGQFAGFVEGLSSTVFGTKLILRTNAVGGFNLGVVKGGGTTTTAWAPDQLNPGDTVLIVGRYTFNQGSAIDDVCDLWVNPDPSTFESTNAPAPSASTGSGSDLANIDRFFFRGGSGNPTKAVADELRVGLTWADVTPKIPSTPPSLVAVLNGNNVTLTWPANYVGYILEGTDALSDNPVWNSISYTSSGPNNTATISASAGNQFLRLRK